VVIGLVLYGVIAFVNRSTPTKTLNAFCSALKSGDYQTAYNQLSSDLQSKSGSEAQFAVEYASNLGLGKITNCTVTNVNDAAGSGTISAAFADGGTLVDDYILVNESGSWKINSQQTRSSPTITLHAYCDALNRGDYQTAYNQLSSTAQSQVSEAQFANLFIGNPVTSCMVSNVDDTAGTGSISFTFANGGSNVRDYTLIDENGTWKIVSGRLRQP
jgi:limonene-1,2-epoxide hydrolase